MTDFFREVDEELRNDRMKAIWKNYGKWIIATVALIIFATAGYRFYLGYVDSQAGQSGDKYLQAQQLIDNGDRAGAQKLLDELSKDGWGAYPQLAKLRAASSLSADGKKADALAAFEALAAGGDLSDELKDYAALQAALLAVDLESYDDVLKRTDQLVKSDNPWRHLATEARALSAWKAGSLENAAKWVGELKIISEIPSGLRQRVQVLEELIISRGGKLPTSSESG